SSKRKIRRQLPVTVSKVSDHHDKGVERKVTLINIMGRRSQRHELALDKLFNQPLQQCLCLLQTRRIKSLREPAIDRRQQRIGFSALALALPQKGQAHGGGQLPRLRLLAAFGLRGRHGGWGGQWSRGVFVPCGLVRRWREGGNRR